MKALGTTARQLAWIAAAATAVVGLAAQNVCRIEARPDTEERIGSTDRNKATARRWSEELWSEGKLAVADEIIAADYVRHDPGDPFPARGPADVKRIVTMLRTMLPDFQITVQSVIAEGDLVVSRYTATGTDTVGYMGLPPTGRTILTAAMQMFRFDRSGRIVESWAARDDLGTLQQLGHLPAFGPNRAKGEPLRK